MAHNLIISNGLDVNPKAELQTTTRPILVQYKYSPNDATPIPILVQVDVFVEENGTFIQIGSTQVSSKDYDSTATNTVFTFDISSMLQSKISTGFYTDIFTTNTISSIDFKNSGGNEDYKSVIRYKTEARAWYADDANVITLNEDDGIHNPDITGYKFACDLYFKDKELSNSKYVNMPLTSKFVLENSTTDITNGSFLTNCPPKFRRKIAIGMPFYLSVLHYDLASNVSVKCYNQPYASPFSTDNLGPITLSSNSPSIRTKNLTFSDSYLFLQTSSSESTTTKNLSIFLDSATGEDSEAMRFEVMNNSTSTNAVLSRMKNEATSIYFVNDFGVLDYFTFDSDLDIVHEHSKTTFKTGYKDYTSRLSSKRGVSTGKTTEIRSCYSYVNREVSEWLSEIYRSKEVYLYERDSSEFVPIIVLEGDTQPSYSCLLYTSPSPRD